MGVVGECNIQYALNPESEEYCIIEVSEVLALWETPNPHKPRTSVCVVETCVMAFLLCGPGGFAHTKRKLEVQNVCTIIALRAIIRRVFRFARDL